MTDDRHKPADLTWNPDQGEPTLVQFFGGPFHEYLVRVDQPPATEHYLAVDPHAVPKLHSGGDTPWKVHRYVLVRDAAGRRAYVHETLVEHADV